MRCRKIIDASESLKGRGFKIPDKETLRHQDEMRAGEEILRRRGTQFGIHLSLDYLFRRGRG
jgi:hypothetical protein